MAKQQPQPETAIAVSTPPGALARYNEEQLRILKAQIAYPEIKDDELAYFLMVAQKADLDPFAKPAEVYVVPRKAKKEDREPKASIMVSVDGLIKLAARTGRYQGHGEPEYLVQLGPNEPDQWLDYWRKPMGLFAMRADFFFEGFRKPLRVMVMRSSFESGNNPLWQTMPEQMLYWAMVRQALRRSGVLYEIPEAKELQLRLAPPPVDEEGEFLPLAAQPLTASTRGRLHGIEDHATIHTAAVEAFGHGVRDLTEAEGQDLLAKLSRPLVTEGDPLAKPKLFHNTGEQI